MRSEVFACRLQATLVDPVIAADGHTYERSAIQSHLQHQLIASQQGASCPQGSCAKPCDAQSDGRPELLTVLNALERVATASLM